jgi:phosphopantothenoylcysteine decarboxylase/phosphopantothenate--cysteine ligase
MRCIVTAGPTYEPLDQVRRLTNFSTGRLGSELAGFLAGQGHEVTLLVGQLATWAGERRAVRVETFTTTASLLGVLRSLSAHPCDAVFHTAAVSDFAFGRVFARSAGGELTEVRSGKISSRQATLLAELVPTPKIIAELRGLFPAACLVGWKYEVEGDCAGLLRLAERQIAECRTNACVVNGPAYGAGFGLVKGSGEFAHLPDAPTLYGALARVVGVSKPD